MTTAKCKSCGAELIWARTANGKRTPLDAKPVRVAKRPAAHVLRNEAKEARWSVACWSMDARGRSGSMDFCPKCIAAHPREPLTDGTGCDV